MTSERSWTHVYRYIHINIANSKLTVCFGYTVKLLHRPQWSLKKLWFLKLEMGYFTMITDKDNCRRSRGQKLVICLLVKVCLFRVFLYEIRIYIYKGCPNVSSLDPNGKAMCWNRIKPQAVLILSLISCFRCILRWKSFQPNNSGKVEC